MLDVVVYDNIIVVGDNYGGAGMSQLNLRLVNLDTGELMDAGVPVWVGKKVRSPYGKRWFMTSQDAVLALAQDKDLAGRPTRVLLYMLARLDFENFILVPQAEVAQALNLDRGNVSKALKLLEAKGILHRGPKLGQSFGWRLNANFGWKGKVRNQQLQLLPGGKIEA